MHDDLDLPDHPTLADLQRFTDALERHHGWDRTDLVQTMFLMTEELGELVKAVRRHVRLYDEGAPTEEGASVEQIGDEIVDVFNYLLAVANRAGVDVEEAFRRKNARNLQRRWT